MSSPTPSPDRLELIAYPLHPEWRPAVVPAQPQRDWMVQTEHAFANRCLPLLMANQSGWHIQNIDPFRATWDGSDRAGGIVVESLREDGAPAAMVASQFGYGVLTWTMPYLFRTSAGYNLLVRGPANLPRDGIAALEGLVEADAATQTFTMNWKFTRPGATVTFLPGEPFCMLVPQRRGELEAFRPRVESLESDPETARRLDAFLRQRKLDMGMRRVASILGGVEAQLAVPYARHYFDGRHTTDEPFPEHQRRRSIQAFAIDQP